MRQNFIAVQFEDSDSIVAITDDGNLTDFQNRLQHAIMDAYCADGVTLHSGHLSIIYDRLNSPKIGIWESIRCTILRDGDRIDYDITFCTLTVY